MSQAVKTTDHDEIRTWAEERNGRPAVIRTKGRKGGVLRIDFGEPEDDLKEIEWDEFFEIFDDANLAFLHQDETGEGDERRFSKFVNRYDQFFSEFAKASSASAALPSVICREIGRPSW